MIRMSVALFSLLSFASIATAQSPDLPPQASVQDQMAYGKFLQVVDALQKDPRFAGEHLTLIAPAPFAWDKHEIDRRNEPKPPATANRVSISDIVGNVSSELRGSMNIKIHEEYNSNGTLVVRDWQIDFGGSETIGMGGKEDADGKQHR